MVQAHKAINYSKIILIVCCSTVQILKNNGTQVKSLEQSKPKIPLGVFLVGTIPIKLSLLTMRSMCKYKFEKLLLN